MRKLASIVKINDVIKHPNADSLDICTVGGWKCVSKLNEFQVNELAVYFSIDSWLPQELAPWLCKNPCRFFENIPGERLRTVKLRGQLSQGLLMPVSIISDESLIFEGSDVTDYLNIRKYEKPLDISLTGLAKGNFPSFIPKTDLTRIQSLTLEFDEWKQKDYTWTIEEKVDGSSTTAFIENDELNVCSRNLNLKESDNAYWIVARDMQLFNKLKEINCAIQFETAGNKINGNLYKHHTISGYVFDLFDIQKQKYLLPHERNEILRECGLHSVPILQTEFRISSETTVDDLLEMADGNSVINPQVYREGLVFRCEQDSDIRFKVISNKFLLKYDS